MKHLNYFNNFKLNEEVSFKYLMPLLASLFLNLKSAYAFSGGAHAAHSRGGGGGHRSSLQVSDELSKIKFDLRKLKSIVNDPEITNLIDQADELSDSRYDSESIKDLCSQIEVFLQNNDYYDRELSDSLNHLKYGDIEQLKNDYKVLLNKYEKYESDRSSDSNMSFYLMIGLVIFLVLYFIHFFASQGKSTFFN
jgi:hypothetical protein